MKTMEKKAPLRMFQVEGGSHTEGGKTYKRGEVVHTSNDLAKMFRGKFKEVGVVAKVDPTLVDPNMEELRRERQERRAAEMLQAPKAAKAAKSEKTDAAALKARGLDVTERFPRAVDEGFEVMKREKQYHVYEKGQTKPLNEDPLERDGVEAFVDQYLEG